MADGDDGMGFVSAAGFFALAGGREAGQLMGRKVGAGGAAKIHAARARKARAQLDRVKEALIAAGFPAEDEDDDGVARAVEILCGIVREQKAKLEDYEWEAAGSGEGRAERLTKVLAEIADEDYRGNRSSGSQKAHRALVAEGLRS